MRHKDYTYLRTFEHMMSQGHLGSSPKTYWPLLPLLIDIGGQTKHLCKGTWTVLNCSTIN